MKTLGLIGGMSWESSAEYYRLLNRGVKQRLGGQHNARSLLLTVDFHDVETLMRNDRWDDAGHLLAGAAQTLERAGADALLLCTNTLHKVAAAVESAVTIPLLHIADATGAAITRAGMTRIGLLGTRFTMEQDFYRQRLEQRFGLSVITPGVDQRNEINRIVFDELCQGRLLAESRQTMLAAIEALGAAGAEGVILGCTEFSLLVKPGDATLPLFDTTALHAETAIAFALADAAEQSRCKSS